MSNKNFIVGLENVHSGTHYTSVMYANKFKTILLERINGVAITSDDQEIFSCSQDHRVKRISLRNKNNYFEINDTAEG